MGALKTSEQGDVVAGEGVKDPATDERTVDTGAKIIIGPEPIPAPMPRVVAPLARRPQRRSQMPVTPVTRAPEPRRGVSLLILLYVLSAGALAFAIYERFVA